MDAVDKVESLVGMRQGEKGSGEKEKMAESICFSVSSCFYNSDGHPYSYINN